MAGAAKAVLVTEQKEPPERQDRLFTGHLTRGILDVVVQGEYNATCIGKARYSQLTKPGSVLGTSKSARC